MQPKIITQEQLASIDPITECFIIKNVISPETCQKLLDFLSHFSQTYADNEKVADENWHYWVTSRGNYFDSFLFNNLQKLNHAELTETYHKIYKLYQQLGEQTFLNDFKAEIGMNETHQRTINPLVFWYKAEQSQFGWHKHNTENQKFQLLLQLTRPLIDYTEGETLIYMGKDQPNPEALQPEDCVVFDNNFEQGDIFSFPYDKWHRVNKVASGHKGMDARVSLLMPLAPRNSYGNKNEYLS